jgi:hypothetical protein
MINSTEVLSSVQSGTTPTTWRVLPAQNSFFLKKLGGYALFLLFVLGCIVYLTLNPDFVITLKGISSLDDNSFTLWRTINFVFLGLCLLGSAVMCATTFQDFRSISSQMMVILPEGVVMKQSKTTPEVIDYAALKSITFVGNKSGEAKLRLTKAQEDKSTTLELDGRFGQPKALSQDIIQGHQTFKNAHQVQ